MNRHHLASLFAFVLLIFSSHISAAIYKWTNEEGQVHYGSMPPQGVAAEKMGVSTKFTPPPATKKKTANNKASAPAEGKDSDKENKDPYSKEQHTTLCNNAKNDLATLNKGGRLRVKQKDGSTVVMDEETKTKRMKNMQAMMKKHCK